MDDLRIAAEDVRSPDARALLERLEAELTERYSTPASAFAPEDVEGPGGVFLVARLAGQAVGCGAVRPLEPGVGEVKRMFVEPAWRGRGIARRILAALEECARGAGFHTLRLETALRQPEAIGLYESAGYRHIACWGVYAGNPLSVCFERAIGGS
jgi:GNAT superfamily N-acetyltransferase